jgi:hypothetical protein
MPRFAHRAFRLAAFWAGLLLLAQWTPSAALAAEPAASPWQITGRIPLAENTWRWNWSSWDQEKIVSFGDYQYTVFWNAEGQFVLARRDLRDDRVQQVVLREFTLSADDGHRNTCLGISPADGRLHLSWDHHNNPLNYAKSRKGLIADPPERITADDIEPRQRVSSDPSLTSRTTYPRFINDPQGTLYLFYRQGGSGNGDNYLFRYDAEKADWHLVGQIFSRRGTYGPWGNSTSRNAYFHDLLFDADGRLHATWVYREKSATWASNHDLHYASSDDGGRTWHNNAGEKIADMAEGDPIELDDPGIVVRRIPVFSWMMNAGCMALDSQGRPHVITYKLPEPRKPKKLQHNPPPEIHRHLHFVHYWRNERGQWLGGEPIEPLGGPGNVARGDIVFGPDDTLYFFCRHRKQGGMACLEAEATGGWKQWRGYALTPSGVASTDATKHDRRRWQQQGVLSLTARLPEAGFGIVELKLEK